MQEHVKKDDSPVELSEEQSLKQPKAPTTRRCTCCGLELPANVEVCPQDGTRVLSPLSEDGTLKAKYEFLGTIGSGGMGVIYKARQRILNKMVAIKVLHSHLLSLEAMRRFQLEGKATSQLKHQGIVSVLDFGVTEPGQPYMVMDYVEGQTLSALLKQSGPLKLDRFLNIFIQVCDALEHAHSRSILHRDVKPSNIMLVRNAAGQEEVRIMDFGIAKLLDDTESGAQHLTRTGEAIGSPLYMSPEQCRCSALDQRSDIYSVGCVMYEALAGTPPFLGNSTIATLMMHINDDPLPMSEGSLAVEINPRMQEIVSRTLKKNPDERPQSMGHLKNDLLALQAELESGIPSLSLTAAASPQPQAKTRTPLWKFLALPVCAILTLAIYLVANHEPATKQSTATSQNGAGQQKPLVDNSKWPLSPAEKGDQYDGTVEDGIKSLVRSNAQYVDLSISEDLHDLSDKDMRYLADDSQLKRLVIKRANITDAGLHYLKGKPLIELDLSHCPVKDLDALRNSTTLHRLILTDNRVSTKGMQAIATIANLQSLDLVGTQINNSDLLLLADLHNLQQLNLSACPNISKEGVEKLVQKLGNHCKVLCFVEQPLADARKLMQQNNYAAADKILANALYSTYNLSSKAKQVLLETRGSCQLHLKEFDAAVQTFSEAVANADQSHQIQRSIGNSIWIAATLEKKNLQKENKNDVLRAIDIREKAASHLSKSSALLVDNASGLAYDYLFLGEKNKAEKMLLDVLPTIEQHATENPQGTLECFAALGGIALTSGRNLMAVGCYQKALKYGTPAQEEPAVSMELAGVRLRLAGAYAKSNQLEQAKTILNEALLKPAPDELRRQYYGLLYTVAQKQQDNAAMEKAATALHQLDLKAKQSRDN
jgi:serine/threonine protein kinase